MAKDYLKELAVTPDAGKYPLIQAWLRTDDRLPFFKQLRAQKPILETPECTLVANFVDVRDMLQMPDIFTVDLYKPKMGVDGPDTGYLMAHDDDALHYREKSLMQGLLNRNDLPRVRKMVASDAARVLRDARGSMEFINDYCRRVPVMLVQGYFGLDGVDEADLIRWSYWNQYDAFNNQPFDMLSDATHDTIVAEHDKASRELAIYITLLMARKLFQHRVLGLVTMLVRPLRRFVSRLFGMTPEEPFPNMVDRMVQARFDGSTEFSIVRVGTNAGGLLIGAIETTSQAVAQVIELFINDPQLMKKAKDLARGSDTQAFDNMVWEALRFVPIRPDIFRLCQRDCTVGKGTHYQTTIKKGTIVRLLIHSAMFDEFAYEKPEDFVPGRNFYHHFIFGSGPHECLGKYVGMEMVPEMVRQAVLLDGLSSKSGISYVNEAFFPGRQGPFPESYPVQWNS